MIAIVLLQQKFFEIPGFFFFIACICQLEAYFFYSSWFQHFLQVNPFFRELIRWQIEEGSKGCGFKNNPCHIDISVQKELITIYCLSCHEYCRNSQLFIFFIL